MEKDFDWGVFFKDAERFADFVNCEGFQGKEVVKAAQVEEADPRLFMVFGERINGAGVPVQYASAGDVARREGMALQKAGKRKSRRGKYKKGREKKITRIRDCVRKVALGANFVIVDVETQETLDYSYPLRDMGYLYGEYERQAEQIRKKNRRENKEGRAETRQRGPGEILYRFRKEDRLKPTVVFLLYSGKEEWMGPLDLYDMLDLENVPPELKYRLQNHRVNLVDIHRMTEEQLAGYVSDVGKVFRLIRYSEEKEKLYETVSTDEYYENMPQDAYRVAANYINAVELTNMEKYRTETEGYRMCTAIRELIEDGRSEGRAEGRAEGVTMGKEEGERRVLTRLTCRKLRRHKTPEEIADELEEDIEVIRIICEAAASCAPDYDEGSVFELYRKKLAGSGEV